MLSACGLLVAPAFASCAFVIEWNGVRYDPWSNERPVSFGRSLGDGTVPFCDDTEEGGCERGHDESIEVFRIVGVDPHVAVAAHDRRVRTSSSLTGSSRSCPTTPCTRTSTGL